MSIYNDATYRKRRAALRRREYETNAVCWLCGHPFEWDAPAGEPLSWTADHLNAIANGGSLLGEMRGAHHRCNSSRGKKKDARIVRKPKTSRDWYK